MIRDYNFFHRRYAQIEEEFLQILDFIEISDNFGDPCYKVSSSKLMDFCLKVGTEVETLFRLMLENSKFDGVTDISTKRNNQNIRVYREVIDSEYDLKDYKLKIKLIKKKIFPFENFDTSTPEWFRIYSRHKHNKIELLNQWNLKLSLYALGSLLILVINHPSLDGKEFRAQKVSQRVFDLLGSKPKFCGISLQVTI